MGKFAKKNQKELRQEAKRRSRTGRKGAPKETVEENDDQIIDADSADLLYDDVDQFHQKKRKSLEERGVQYDEDDDTDREEEILPVGGDDDDTEDEDEAGDDDLSEEAGLPSRSAWGANRSTYYKTDFVDKDHGRFQGSDAEEAEEEEREARELQAKLVADLADDDFGLSDKLPAIPSDERTTEVDLDGTDAPEVTVTDLSRLSDFEKLERIKQESPELLELIADTKKKFMELRMVVQPIINALQETIFLSHRAELYIRTKYQLILGYCQNVAFYLSLKAKRVPVENHPVTRRLVDFRKLLLKLEPLDNLYAGDIRQALDAIDRGTDLTSLCSGKVKRREKKVTFASPAPKVLSKKEQTLAERLSGKDTQAAEKEDEEMEDASAGDAKRAATYQIVKNKGITPYRKKEFRNPRVKHRMKYRKALISRKGQVREHRPELKKYAGEASGIRAGVVRSVKFK